MSGVLKTELSRVVVMDSFALSRKLIPVPMFGSVNGHAQAPVVIRRGTENSTRLEAVDDQPSLGSQERLRR